MPTISLTTNATLAYEDVGNGEPIIALHGLLGTARIDLGDVIDELSKSFRVIAPTMRGYGESLPKPRRFPPDFYEVDAADVLALMDALHITRAHLIGYSDGGEVAIIAATMQPERVLSVATWGSIGLVPPELMPDADNAGDIPGVSADEMLTVARERHGIENPEAAMEEWYASYAAIIQRGDLSIGQADQLTMPVLLMLGDRDPLAPVQYGEQFVQRAPNARLQLFPGGHAVHQEHFGEFMESLTRFLKQAVTP